MSLRSEHAAQQAQIADLKGQLARALAPSERVDFGVQKSGPRRANDRPHGTEGIASMQDTPYANGGDLYRVEDRGYVTPCWVWLRHIQPNGYGATNRPMSDGRRTRVAHRWMYDRHVGPIPEGLEIDHLCRVRCCVNPDHLELVGRRENMLRGETLAAVNARKEHCIHGHPLSGENLYVTPQGKRNCMECRREANRRHYARKVAA